MKAYKITHLSIFFAFFVAFLAAVLLFIVLQQFEGVSEEQSVYEKTEAIKELNLALKELRQYARGVGKNINDWGETKHQFVNREFYHLWREMRVIDSGMLPSAFDEIALYDIDGKIFGAPSREKPMPLITIKGVNYVQKTVEDNTEYWTYFFPVKSVDLTAISETREIVLGYAGIKFSLRRVLTEFNDYKFIDENSISSVFEDKAVFDFSVLNESFTYRVKEDKYRKVIEETTNKAIVQIILFFIGMILIAIIALNWLLMRPLKNISLQINNLNKINAFSEITAVELSAQPIYELENVRSSFNSYQTKITELNKNLESNNVEFSRLANEDSLTGAYNRRAFEDDWQSYNDECSDDESYAILIFDCDNFKPINDSYGHGIGDIVISKVASVLMKSIRSQDKIYRLGGDEFASILRGVGENEAVTIAENCRKNVLSYNFRRYGLFESISVSAGISVTKGPEETFTNMMKHADLAMYMAKRPASSSIMVYANDLFRVESITSKDAVNAVFSAISQPDLITMRYQPVVKLPTMEVSYVEALVTIQHDNKSYMPDVIFPVVEARKLDVEFDLSVLEAVSRDLSLGFFPKDNGISVNLSAASVINARVIDLLIHINKSYPDRKIIIEITETALITQITKATSNIHKLREDGFLIALDDFGSGYSSLRYLTSMPVDIIKFDISLIHLLQSDNAEHRNMIEKLTTLIIDLDYDVVAEGIESKELLDKVIKLGFAYSQGYYTGRPEFLAADKNLT